MWAKRLQFLVNLYGSMPKTCQKLVCQKLVRPTAVEGVASAFSKSWQPIASSEIAAVGWTEHLSRWVLVAYRQLAQGMRCIWRTFSMPCRMFLKKLQTVSRTVLHRKIKQTAGSSGRIQTINLASSTRLIHISWSTKGLKSLTHVSSTSQV